MYCPVCRDEYRPGFTRCATCDVDLVDALDSKPTPRPAPVVQEVAAEEPAVNFCGFLTLAEAREARDKVRAARLAAEILIRDAPGSTPPQEEFWLRIRPRDVRAVAELVGFVPAVTGHAEDEFACSACGATVRASDDSCPGCGLGFAG